MSVVTEKSASRQRLLNVPNQLTVARLLLSLVLFVLIATQYYLAATLVFVVAAGTDWLDGYWARKYGQVTNLGRILDPFVDKIIICGTFIFLVAVPDSGVAAWMAVVIVGRELAVTGLRGLASAGGHVLAASWLGKLKTLTQNIAIGALLFHFPQAGIPAHEVGMAFLFLSTAVTLASGYLYFADYFREHARAGREDARR